MQSRRKSTSENVGKAFLPPKNVLRFWAHKKKSTTHQVPRTHDVALQPTAINHLTMHFKLTPTMTFAMLAARRGVTAFTSKTALTRAASTQVYRPSPLMFAEEGQAEVVLVGCGAPNRGMGWYVEHVSWFL